MTTHAQAIQTMQADPERLRLSLVVVAKRMLFAKDGGIPAILSHPMPCAHLEWHICLQPGPCPHCPRPAIRFKLRPLPVGWNILV
jgi:hypothetical protein